MLPILNYMCFSLVWRSYPGISNEVQLLSLGSFEADILKFHMFFGDAYFKSPPNLLCTLCSSSTLGVVTSSTNNLAPSGTAYTYIRSR